ncbi:DUF2225 domain-containing protein [Leadbettera azotonutricia]|uniref:DUF2225 domain-containing protein n=1 Tax=Leadbettera azotonutricia (strain ATCC BAA-888 / DSM 13862 / ZAS-9) TaxID=545695 RepID=F5YEX6_LEAAZ|nr:DUF2225 domain-containing protein [Leadbettera azotonutricia]AEF81666.1 conserved hypothetical protein [Leadbettera azotonutricia ZAS-9]
MKYEERDIKVSFQSKEEYVCPVCETSFHREELLSGSGRLIAGALTDELHRLYEPSAKYGYVYPLAYTATVCPECWFASDQKDFPSLPHSEKDKAFDERERRVAETRLIFPDLDFHNNRDLVAGAASQYLTTRCYDFYPKEFSPTIKQAIASLRTGWLLEEMENKFPGQHYDWLALLFKKKAMFFYNEAIRREQSGKETLSGLKVFGPDTDKNYAYEGALYLSALLKFKYGFQDNLQLRAPALDEAKRTIAKIFGVGKSSKSKPGPLLEHARNLYDKISKELNETDE